MNRIALLILTASLAGVVHAQTPIGALITAQKAAYNSAKNNWIKTAEKMPEENYSYKPTPDVQTFAERVAHMAGQIGGCSRIKGEAKQNPATGKTSKADLVAALKASFDECDAAWESMNDTTAVEMMAGRGGAQTPKIGTLIQNNVHLNEVYGATAVYLRLKGIVPPSSEGARGGR
jgi:hypothetical protein